MQYIEKYRHTNSNEEDYMLPTTTLISGEKYTLMTLILLHTKKLNIYVIKIVLNGKIKHIHNLLLN